MFPIHPEQYWQLLHPKYVFAIETQNTSNMTEERRDIMEVSGDEYSTFKN